MQHDYEVIDLQLTVSARCNCANQIASSDAPHAAFKQNGNDILLPVVVSIITVVNLLDRNGIEGLPSLTHK